MKVALDAQQPRQWPTATILGQSTNEMFQRCSTQDNPEGDYWMRLVVARTYQVACMR